MKSKCYLSQKRELLSRHEAEVAGAATAQGGAGGAVKGTKRVLSSAFSLDTLAGLEMECSTTNFGNIDLAEQHAIMSEIMASRRNGRQQPAAQASLAASRRRSSGATSISGGAGSGAYHDSYAGDPYSSQASDLNAIPNAAQVLANSLGNQVKRISMSLSSVAKTNPSMVAPALA